MPGLNSSFEDLVRLDLKLPFFMRDDPFDVHQFSCGSKYNWLSDKHLTLIVQRRNKSSRSISSGDTGLVGGIRGLNISGNPLECPFDLDEDFEEAEILQAAPADVVFSSLDFPMNSYTALDIKSSRILTSKIQRQDEDAVRGLGLGTHAKGMVGHSVPIYIATEDPKNPELALTGLQNETYLGLKVSGPFFREPSTFDLDYFVDLHDGIPRSAIEVLSGKPIHKDVHVIYEIPYGVECTAGRVFLEFVWSNPKDIFGLPPPNARSKVAIRPKPGDANGQLKTFWEEVALLDKLIGMRESDKNPDNNKTYYHQHGNNSTATDEASIVRKIQELVKLPSTPSWNYSQDYASAMNVVLQRVLEADRSDVDFTDKAWAILKNTTNIPEAYECFYEIFLNVERGYWRPYLLPTNKSSFGDVVKDLRDEKVLNFRTVLTPNLALDMIIEFGITKLHRDYTFLLSILQLADRNLLVPFTPDLHDHRGSLLKINKMHCVLEVMCLAKDRLGLHREDHQTFAQTVLTDLKDKVSMDWNEAFHFDVGNDQLLAIIASLKMTYWNLRLETVGPLRFRRTNFIFCRESFVCLAKKRLENVVQGDGPGTRPWYLYIRRFAQRRQ